MVGLAVWVEVSVVIAGGGIGVEVAASVYVRGGGGANV